MTASEVFRIARDYEYDYLYSPLNTDVKLGCDCGCGGDTYTDEEWEEMIVAYYEADKEFKEFCEQHGIEWDMSWQVE